MYLKIYRISGDDETGEDQAIIGGIAFLDNIPVTVIGHQKGKTDRRKNY